MPLPSVVPLTSSQVDAASRLHSRLKQWSATDSAPEALGRVFPGFDLAASLLKVSALNQLYGTNVYAVLRMAEHVGGACEAGGRPMRIARGVGALALLSRSRAPAPVWMTPEERRDGRLGKRADVPVAGS